MKLGEIFNDIYPYILQVLLGTVALFGSIKDWEDYGNKFGRFRHLRWALLLFTIAVIALTLYDTHSSRREARQKEQAAEKTGVESKAQIGTLTQQITLERDENKTNADGFRKSFDSLYQKYSDLAAKTQNKELMQELA
jgi:hypothetical protein